MPGLLHPAGLHYCLTPGLGKQIAFHQEPGVPSSPAGTLFLKVGCISRSTSYLQGLSQDGSSKAAIWAFPEVYFIRYTCLKYASVSFSFQIHLWESVFLRVEWWDISIPELWGALELGWTPIPHLWSGERRLQQCASPCLHCSVS